MKSKLSSVFVNYIIKEQFIDVYLFYILKKIPFKGKFDMWLIYLSLRVLRTFIIFIGESG